MPQDITEETKLYLKGLEEASKRSRWLFYLILTVTAFIFAFNWKMNKPNWIDERIQWRKDVVDKLDQPKKYDVKQVEAEYSYPLSQLGVDLKSETHRKILRDQLEDLCKKYDETYKVPFLGMDFDINDFGLFSGAQLFILGFVFMHCLFREEQNAVLFFEHAKKMKGYPAGALYHIASMGQVLTIPTKKSVFRMIFRLAPPVMILFPVLVQWWVLGGDLFPNTEQSCLLSWMKIFNPFTWAPTLEKTDDWYLDHFYQAGHRWFATEEFILKIFFTVIFSIEMGWSLYYFLKIDQIWQKAKSN